MKLIVSIGDDTHVVTIANGAATLGDADPNDAAGDARLDPTADPALFTLRIGDRVARVVLHETHGRGDYTLEIDGERYRAEALTERARTIREMTARNAPPAGPAPVIAPMPGLITKLRVAVGDAVEAGQGVLVMEAMKMENELRAATAGRVKNIRVAPGAAVEKGAILVELE